MLPHEVEQVDDIVNRNRKTSANFSMPAVKIDMNSYPEFDGQLKNWKSFKKKFKSIATMHRIGTLLQSTYMIPTDLRKLQE